MELNSHQFVDSSNNFFKVILDDVTSVLVVVQSKDPFQALLDCASIQHGQRLREFLMNNIFLLTNKQQ
jgi:hypothetical protein